MLSHGTRTKQLKMKRSKNIVLTLLVPAMAAFGCSREEPPDVSGGSFAETSALEQTADLNGDGKISDEERKEASANGPVAHNAPTTVHRSRGFMPIPTPIPMGGNRGRVAPVAPPRANPSPTSPHPSSTPGNSVSRGGFGGTGSHLSGAS